MQQNQDAGRTKVVLDAMGGDYAPAEPVKGAVDAVCAREDIEVILVGQEDVVRGEADVNDCIIRMRERIKRLLSEEKGGDADDGE